MVRPRLSDFLYITSSEISHSGKHRLSVAPSWRVSHSSPPLSSSDHPSTTAPKALRFFPLLCVAVASIVNTIENKGRESESWEGWQAERGDEGRRARRGECALSVIRPGRGPPTLGCGNSIAASWFLQRSSSSCALPTCENKAQDKVLNEGIYGPKDGERLRMTIHLLSGLLA